MVSFISGIYDVDTIPPHRSESYDIKELPLGAESDLSLEEKLDIIFNLSDNEKQQYEHYIHKLSTYKGKREILQDTADIPEFTKLRNQFIYDRLDGTPDRFIKGIINKHYDTLRGCEGLTYTDLIQEGWIALIKVAKRYMDNEKINNNTAKFSTVAYYRVEGRVQDIFRKEVKTSIAESKYDKNKFENSIEKEALAIHKAEQLDDQQQEILELYAMGYTQEEISDNVSFQISQQHVSRILNKIKTNV